jgi:hypothetical protein
MKLERVLILAAAAACFESGCASNPPMTPVRITDDQGAHTEVTMVPAYLPEPRYRVDEREAVEPPAYAESAACPAEIQGTRVDAVPSKQGMTLVFLSEQAETDVTELRARARRLAELYEEASADYSVSTEQFERGIKLVFEADAGSDLSELRSALSQQADAMNSVRRCPAIRPSFGPRA